MASREIRYQTMMLLFAMVAAVLIAMTFLASGQQSSDDKLFIFGLSVILVLMNVVSFFMIWGSSSTMVDEVFVMTPSGMLLKHYTRRLRPDQDEDILAGMLTAVQNFVRESFDTAGGKLSEIRFEHYDILISYTENLVLAAVLSTKNPEKLREKLKDAACEIEETCGLRLKDWKGDMSELSEIDSVMKRLIGRI
jgi:hypothetical protein